MQKIILPFMLLLLSVVYGCQDDSLTLAPNLTSDQIDWSYVETETTNEFIFTNSTEEVSSIWDFGNGQSATGTSGTAQYANAGTYTITLKVLSAGGETVITEDIVVANSNSSFLEGEVYDNLAGGRFNSEGKVWVMDRYYKPHMGIGSSVDTATEWWSTNPDEKAGLGIYDDSFKFTMTESGLVFEQMTNGDVYANGSVADQLGSTDGHQEPSGDDFIMPFDDATGVWSIGGSDSEITIAGDAFIGYFSGFGVTYKILTLTDNVLEIANLDPSGNAWFQRFVTPDNMEPAPLVEPAEPTSIEVLNDMFGVSSSTIWAATGDNTLFDTAAVDPEGSSNEVAKYSRATADHFAEVHTDLDGVIDFSQGAQIRVNVFVPSSNDYTMDTKEDWATYPSDADGCKTLEIKLHNTEKGGNSWQTQMTIKTDVLKDYEDQWVTLLFDFNYLYQASISNEDRDLMDRVILQFGGEGWSYQNSIDIYYDNIMGVASNATPVILGAPDLSSANSSFPVVLVK